MSYKSNILLGQITKTSGFEGDVIVKLEKAFVENIPEMESVFLEIEGRPVPFFISKCDYSGAGILKLAFRDYDSAEQAGRLKGCRVFLTGSAKPPATADELNTITGFTLFDQEGKNLGSITEIIESTGQLLLRILSPAQKELLVPLHEDLILGINKKERSISMEIPEGLTDLS